MNGKHRPSETNDDVRDADHAEPADESLVDAGDFWARRNAGSAEAGDLESALHAAEYAALQTAGSRPEGDEDAANAGASANANAAADSDAERHERELREDLTDAIYTGVSQSVWFASQPDVPADFGDPTAQIPTVDSANFEAEVPELAGLLVANRGEIARRVFRSAHPQTKTIAVFSEPDRDSAHVRDADVAVALGGLTSTESYLDADKVLTAALRAGASAVHPGYGFLSENPDFAQAVMDAGLLWVGPTPDSIRKMALKVEAKRIAERAGVPLVPGAEIAPEATDAELVEAGERVGYPLLVKASAGGGGKGMRVVASADELLDAVAGARREAQNSFGDPTVFFERYLTGARHVEVQVFGDTHGNVVHLFERECSIQRRHQKIVEESPSPGATLETLSEMYRAAVSLAQEIDYVGAGTVEFLVFGDGADQEFYFLEMNTRLQVEHPVTEAVTGLDLVAWQLMVAAGEELPLSQEQITRHGHAIEVRLYAEDPANDYLPSTGELVGFDYTQDPISAPPRAREELSAEQGDEVSPYYDPMIGKIISQAATRSAAANDLARNLRGRDIAGVTTNRDSLVAILESEPFANGATATDFLELHPGLLSEPIVSVEAVESSLIAAALAADWVEQNRAPWHGLASPGWSNIAVVPNRRDFTFARAGDLVAKTVVTDYADDTSGVVAVRDGEPRAGWSGGIDGQQFAVDVIFEEPQAGTDQRTDGPTTIELRVDLDGMLRRWVVTRDSRYIWVNDGRDSMTFELSPRFADADHAGGAGGPAAPVPGTVVSVEVAAGDVVEAGQTLIVLEAMKMEHRIAAALDATIDSVLVSVGQAVDAHQPLVTLVATEESQ